MVFQKKNIIGGEKQIKIIDKDNSVIQNLLKISNNGNEIYNALVYLRDKKFIEVIAGNYLLEEYQEHFQKFRVSALGIDMIEGIERGKEEKSKFNIIFNIKLAENMNVESLLKTEVGSLIKASLV